MPSKSVLKKNRTSASNPVEVPDKPVAAAAPDVPAPVDDTAIPPEQQGVQYPIGPPKRRAFTNIPERVGQESAPNVRFEYAPEGVPIDTTGMGSINKDFQAELGPGGIVEGPVKDVPAMNQALDRIIELEALAERSKITGRVPDKPGSESSSTPSTAPASPAQMNMDQKFSFEGREQFRNQIINSQQLGGVDPYTINPTQVMQRWIAENEEALFEDFTGLDYSFKDQLPNKEAELWNKVRMKQASAIKDAAKEKKATGIKFMSDMMSRFDKQAKEYKSQKSDLSKPPVERYRVNAAGQETLHVWDKNTGSWRDTGTKKASTEDKATLAQKLKYQQTEDKVLALEVVDGDQILTNREATEPILPDELTALNNQRKLLDMPPLIEQVDDNGVYEYVEEGQSDLLATPSVKAAKLYAPEEITKIQQTPGSYMGADGHYYVNDANGKPWQFPTKKEKQSK